MGECPLESPLSINLLSKMGVEEHIVFFFLDSKPKESYKLIHKTYVSSHGSSLRMNVHGKFL